jgi:hypothetical protein
VSDSLHDRYTEVLRRVAADGTELGVWTAPVAYGRAGQVTVTVGATRRADIGAVALEYAGLSTAPGMAAIDSIASAAGTTGHAATVSASPAGRTATPGELELGLYADSGFGDALKAGSGFSERFNSPATEGEMEMLAEDRVLRAGSRPAATAATGSATPWLLADVVFRTAAARPGTAAPMLDARARPAGAAIPLSARRRPHPVAGAVTALLLRGPNGRLVRFYCLVNPSGEPRVSSAWRRIGGPGLNWSDSALESLR